MLRFLHTADWQLGLKARYVSGDQGADLRAVRFDTVRRLAELAHERKVAAVVVAGDVLDDNAVGPRTLQKTREALDAFAPIPVLLLPGNHDPASPDAALARLDGASHVRVLMDARPVEIGDARFHPCPLFRRHERNDPTAELPSRAAGDPILVAIAHGGVLDFDESSETPNIIDAGRVIERGFDYLALGDWHGTLRFDDRVWYSGTPEQTRFKERDAGNALIVEIDEPGRRPRVEKVRTGRTSWLRHQATLGCDEDVGRLELWLDEPPDLPRGAERSMTLVELSLEGTISLEARTRLDEVLRRASGELLHLRLRSGALVNEPTQADVDALRAEGFVGDAVESLRADPSLEASDALALMHRLSSIARQAKR